jgi:putative hydrolase of the HAD superfamily
MPGPIEGVIVDFGGVLAQHPSAEALARLGAAVGLASDGFAEAWRRHRLAYDLGELPAGDYWRSVGGRTYDSDALEHILTEDAACWSVVDQAMVGWLRDLAAAGLRLALLSNMPREVWARLRDGVGWLELCAVVTLSYELRLAKPDPAIFERCLGELGLPAERVLFVDDQPDNIEAARELGLEAVLFTTIEALRDELGARFDGALPLPRPLELDSPRHV